MCMNIVVVNCDGLSVEYNFRDCSEFMELMEDENVNLNTSIPMLDDNINTLYYKGTDVEANWNEEDLQNMEITTVSDLYDWLCSNDCNWFDVGN